MDILLVLGYLLAFLVGVTLGLVGSGGSILTVPILVYLMGLDAVTATGYSLFIVGVAAAVGGVRNMQKGNVDLRAVVIFGVPSMVMAYLMRAFLLPMVPQDLIIFDVFQITKPQLLLILFALVMLMASYRMINPGNTQTRKGSASPAKVALSGLATGAVAGAVGAGGGFLIIPALVFLAKLSMKRAVGTSLVIIAVQSLAGFAGDALGSDPDWNFLALFTAIAVAGIFLGIALAKKIRGEALKTGFGYFILAMGLYIIVQEVLIN